MILTLNPIYEDELDYYFINQKSFEQIFPNNGWVEHNPDEIIQTQTSTLINLLENYKGKEMPIMPITAKTLMNDFNIPEGKTLGNKFKSIVEIWVNNGFKISEKQVQKIVKN